MGVLLLRLSGPLQSWGAASRFTRRGTLAEPTKSGVVGMVASALGRSREDSVDDLTALEFGVRADQPGELVCDLQTEMVPGARTGLPLTHRYYLADARFLAALAGDDDLLERADHALRNPCWPLYLGRRSCPPDAPVSLGVSCGYAGVREALMREPWLAAGWYRREHQVRDLEARCDAREGEAGWSQDDLTLSLSMAHRRYGLRRVVSLRVPICGLAGQAPASHDPMGFF